MTNEKNSHNLVVGADCNKCKGYRDHTLLHMEERTYFDEYAGIGETDKFELLSCLGCQTIALRRTRASSESDYDETIGYIPPRISHYLPDWFDDLGLHLAPEEEFIEDILREVYEALQHKLPAVAAMGIRAVIEAIMISKVGDHGSFKHNLGQLHTQGFITEEQKDYLETIIDMGSAAMHRSFKPKVKDVIDALKIIEQIVAKLFLPKPDFRSLTARIPARPEKQKKTK